MKFNIRMRKVKTSKFRVNNKKNLARAHKQASLDYRKEYQKKFNAAISRTDFSLQELKEMDHPYATRHGSIQTYGTLENYMVHKRSGLFKRSFRIKRKSNQYESQLDVGFDSPVRTEISYIIYGTKIMLPRNPVLGIYQKMEDQRRPARLLKKYLKKAMDKMKG